MTRYMRNIAVLAKPEVTYGVDAAPTGAANAMLLVNARIEPLVGEEVSRELTLPYMGHQGSILVGDYVRMTAELEIAGSGAAGTPPAGGPLLRACGMSEVITAGVDVKYQFVSSLQESASLYFNLDGVLHKMLGVRGTFTGSLTPRQVPRFALTVTGLLGPVTDTALPAVNVAAFQKPVPVNKANTTISLHGYAGACEGLTFDIGNQIEPRLLINQEKIEHVDRAMTGNAIFEAPSLATKNWFETARLHTTGVLAAQHGTVAGNIVKFDAAAVQIGRPTYGDSQKIVNNSLPLMFTPVAGNDEFTITFQ
ncbi:phage tail tube protein [Sinorhizobium fredii]